MEVLKEKLMKTMKTIVLYSSRTGNTKRVAEAIAAALPQGTPCLDLTKPLPENLAGYDCVFLGFWVDKGTADEASRKVLQQLHNKNVALFATLGADPKSDHARKSLEKAAGLVSEGVNVPSCFICQGKVDPKLIEAMYKMFPAGSLHGRNPESEARHKAASTHPDAKDLQDAAAFAHEVLLGLEMEG